MKCVVYNASGVILRVCDVPDNEVTAQAKAGEFVLVGDANPDEHYILGGVVTARMTMPVTINKTSVVADGVDTVVLSNLPVGTLVGVFGPAPDGAVVSDGTLELTFPVPGAYRLQCRCDLYVTKEFFINAS